MTRDFGQVFVKARTIADRIDAGSMSPLRPDLVAIALQSFADEAATVSTSDIGEPYNSTVREPR